MCRLSCVIWWLDARIAWYDPPQSTPACTIQWEDPDLHSNQMPAMCREKLPGGFWFVLLIGLVCLSSGVVSIPVLLSGGGGGWSRNVSLNPRQFHPGWCSGPMRLASRPWKQFGYLVLNILLTLSLILSVHVARSTEVYSTHPTKTSFAHPISIEIMSFYSQIDQSISTNDRIGWSQSI